ncbi:transferrin-like isoform X1 [Diorhabda carinulata]|uniref:transferrin-like isoform X1 n=1 Tax=Diorhabda carinulata TaxID=1163345 RepID=UPI0025A01FD6|nr:transferrin-like isoform X1 [Diorhabda carinulata]
MHFIVRYVFPSILLFSFTGVVLTQKIYQNKLCTDNFIRDACTEIQRNRIYECLEVYSKVECLLNIDQGKHQFAIIDPEQALLANTLVSDNVVVLAEVVSKKSPYQTVVVVRKFYNNSFENLRGKRLCHPGFKHDELVTKFVLNELENRIIDGNTTFCNDSTSILEKELGVLSNFFGKSCRPGPWTDGDDELDARLKEKYSNLCELCGTQKCETEYRTPFNDTLKCLVQNGGDVAISSLSDALIFFNSSDNAENFQYLCPNGSASSSSAPCTWTNQLNRLIITEKSVTKELEDFLTTNMPHHLSPLTNQTIMRTNLEDSLQLVLKMSKVDQIYFIEPVSLTTYVKAKRSSQIITNNSFCDEQINWCTSNDVEHQKCLWLQQASLIYGLQPVIKCVQSQDVDPISCLSDIQSGKSDLAYIDFSFGYTAAKKDLIGIAYPEINPENLATIVIVIRNDTTNIKTLKDLKGKSACIPQYGGKEWLTFIDTLISMRVLQDSCDYAQIFSDFVGSSCVSGANSKDYEFDTGDSEKLCAQCLPIKNTLPAKYCNADSDNKHYGSDGALRCLSTGYGEYAVITIKDIVDFRDNSENFLALSKKGDALPITNWFVNPDSILNVISLGEVVVKNNTSKKEDIIQLLKAIDLHFGVSLNKQFKVFETFNETQDLLFPESTMGLAFSAGSGTFDENFQSLLERSEQCEPKNVATFIQCSFFMTAIIIFVIGIFN